MQALMSDVRHEPMPFTLQDETEDEARRITVHAGEDAQGGNCRPWKCVDGMLRPAEPTGFWSAPAPRAKHALACALLRVVYAEDFVSALMNPPEPDTPEDLNERG